jgi:isopentenyl-diphosphate delta-isomerase
VLKRSYQIGILILVIMLLALSAFFMESVDMPRWSHIASGASTVLFAIPCFWAAKMWIGLRNAILLFIVFGVYALVVEAAAVVTGFPYGQFGYSDRIGFKLFGVVPWTVAFAWTPLLLGAHSLAANLFESRPARIIFTTLALLAFDLVLDPGAVRLGFWQFVEEGYYYGVPQSNFAGWLLSGFVGAVILELALVRLQPLLPTPMQLTASAFLIIFFWTAFAAAAGMMVPAAIGIVVVSGIIIAWYKFHYAFDDRIVLVDEDGNAIGTAAKLAAHNSETRLHRAFSVFIFNPRGEILLQQRALSKKTWPGVWSNSCCGHVMMHEPTAKAAARRLKFELGLSGIDLTMALPDFRYRAEKDGVVENEICPVLVGLTNDQPDPNPSEVENIRWTDWNEFLASMDEPGNEISPWAVKEVRLLAASDVFKKWFASRIAVSGTKAAV